MATAEDEDGRTSTRCFFLSLPMAYALLLLDGPLTCTVTPDVPPAEDKAESENTPSEDEGDN